MRTDSRPRTRSRSVVRARKRARGELQSQAEEDWAPQTQEALRATALADALQRSVNNPNQLAWPDCAAWRSKSMFDVYYKVSQVVERDEWDAFSDSLRRPLPTTFRFTTEASAAFKSEGERILSGWASRGTRRLGAEWVAAPSAIVPPDGERALRSECRVQRSQPGRDVQHR